MARRWLLLGGFAVCLLSVGCFSAGTMAGRGQMVGVTGQLNDARATAAADQKQLALATTELTREQPVVDEYQVKEIEVTFHRALATKDVDLMMSIFADNAVMTAPNGALYVGKAAIRDFFSTKSVAMLPQNHWAALVPAYKITTSVLGNSAQLGFECHLVDIPTGQIKLEHQVDMTLTRSGFAWQVITMKSTAIHLS